MGYAISVVLFLAVILVLFQFQRRAKLREWKPAIDETARRLGLRVKPGRVSTRIEAFGHIRGFEVRIVIFRRLDEFNRAYDRTRITLKSASLECGTLSRELGGFVSDPARLVAACDDFIDSAAELRGDGAPSPSELLERVLRASEEKIRSRSLRRLVERYGKTEETAQALEAALDDPSVHVRIEAVDAIGPRGLKVAAEIADDQRCSSAQRIRAVQMLRKHGKGSTAAVGVLEAILKRSTHKLLLMEAINAIFRIGHKPDIALLEALLRGSDSAIRLEIAKKLKRYADPRAEAILVAFLGSDEDGLRLEAVRSLGYVGTHQSVESLLELTKGVLLNADLREASERAVVAIQARIGAVESGGLSLAPAQDGVGDLSLSREAGALSEAEPEVEVVATVQSEEEAKA